MLSPTFPRTSEKRKPVLFSTFKSSKTCCLGQQTFPCISLNVINSRFNNLACGQILLLVYYLSGNYLFQSLTGDWLHAQVYWLPTRFKAGEGK